MRKFLLLATILFFAFTGLALAGYPAKTIKIIVPSKAGGSTDTSARLFINAAKRHMKGANFVIKNVPGSGGQKGFEEIANSKPDGYTIGMMFTPQIVAHIVSKRARYTLDDFHVMGNMGKDPLIIAVPKNSPFKNLKEFIDAARTKKLTVAVNGIGSDDFVAAKKFENLTGAKFNLLPTKGSTEQKALILGGHVDGSFMNITQLHAQHKAGTAHIIALLDSKRSYILPDLPTAEELGYPVDMTATRGFVTPKGVPEDTAKKLDKLLEDVMNDPEFIAACKKDVIILKHMKGKEYHDYLVGLQAEIQKFFDSTPW
ncbi:MAG: tripartite tricarboxylate transporter substrate binding protein [Deltaproteobacteria bacterium]|nr:tripartite tricarboxylate transporter substrate binding protein [Deltaproteobacteria bacterium]